jgi:succinate-semialdehyde dehydrogenase/glutarate-semialdehyde dehydrogenase
LLLIEELFGPVASFYVVKDEQAAIDLMIPIMALVVLCLQDIERGRIANQIDTGMVFINHPTWTQADLPLAEQRIQASVGTIRIRNSGVCK